MAGDASDATALAAYEIGEEIGRGAFGIVFAARHRELGRDVAIKQLPSTLDSDVELRARFLAEARLLASLDHPHIVRMYDFIEIEGLCALVMQRLGGGTLADRLAASPLSPQEACAIMVATCDALHHAHGNGILHRDIKPANLMFSDEGVLKVTDFGIAKLLGGAEATLTQTGMLLGTPTYMAPEQVEGLVPTPAVDVYAAGVVFYLSLCGQLPFPSASDVIAELYQRVNDEPIPLLERDPRLPAALARVAARALARDPDARYPSAQAFAVAVHEAATSAWGPGWSAEATDAVPAVPASATPMPSRAAPPRPARSRSGRIQLRRRARPMVGRLAELERVDAVLDGVDDGSSAALALLGEPGIGKTRLLEELQARAAERGHLVLAGRGDEFARDLPFGVLVDAMDEQLADIGPQQVRHLGRDLGAELAHIFPALGSLAGDAGGVLQDERYRAHRALRRLLEWLASDAPVTLVLDDLHWADPASIELIVALLRRPAVAPVLVAVGLRPARAPRRLAAALREAARNGELELIELGPLSAHEAQGLLGEDVERALCDALYRQSGGNPFYLDQLCRAALRGDRVAIGVVEEEPDAVSAAGRAAGVPDAVAAAIADEFAELSAATRSLLYGAAVAGDGFDLDLAAAAAALSEADALAALDDLLELDVVARTDVPRRFRFRHPLVRRAVYAAAPAGWRLGAHERVARELELRRAAPAARAHHVEQFARPGDQAAIAVLKQAGDAAAARAPASAAHWYGAALRLLGEDEPVAAGASRTDLAEQREELLRAMATSLASAGRLVESRTALLELLEHVPDEAVARRVQITAECVRVEHLLGHHHQARERLTAALEEVHDPSSPAAVSLMIELAMDGFYRMDYEAMRAAAERALESAHRLGDRVLSAAADAVLAAGAATAGRVGEGRLHAHEAAMAIDALSDSELALRVDAAGQLAWAEFYLERYDDAMRHIERGMAVLRATGQGQRLPMLMETQGWILVLRGRLAEAAEVQDHAIEAARLSANDHWLCSALFSRAWTARLMGDLDLALRLATESVHASSALDQEGIAVARARGVQGVILMETDPERGVDELLAAGGGPGLPRVSGTRRCVYLEPLTHAELKRGRVEEAARFAERADATARALGALGLSVPRALALRATAAVALARGDAAAAAEMALASAAAAEEVGARVEAALSRSLAGRAFAAAHEHDRATAQLIAAADELGACGARRHRDEALEELRGLALPVGGDLG